MKEKVINCSLSPGDIFNPHRAFHGIWIPQWLEERIEVPEKAKKLYAYLTRFAGEKGKAWPSYNTLAEKLHVSRRYVIQLIQELCNHRLIQVTHINDPAGGHKTNVYEFLWHEWMQGPEDKKFKLVVPEEESPLDYKTAAPSEQEITPLVNSSSLADEPQFTSPSELENTPLVNPSSPKENNKKRINYKRIQVGSVSNSTTQIDSQLSKNQPTYQPIHSVEQEEWMGILKYTYPDRDIEGELKSFQNFCQRKGTAANRNGFVGWLKKASPAIQKISELQPHYTF